MEKQKRAHALGILFSTREDRKQGLKKRADSVSRTYRFPKFLDEMIQEASSQESQTKSDLIFMNLITLFLSRAIKQWCEGDLHERLKEYISLFNTDKIASVEVLNEIMRDMECIHSLVLKEQLEYAEMSKAMKETAEDIEATRNDLSKLYSAKSLDDISNILKDLNEG